MRRDIGTDEGMIGKMSRRKRVFVSGIALLSVMAVLALVSMLLANPRLLSANAAGGSPYVKSGNGAQQNILTIISWYDYNENSGSDTKQQGSSTIAYPKNAGYPTLHNEAMEGTGTYTDPITFAAPDRNIHSGFPIGSIIYVPLVKKYFIMEDQCSDAAVGGCKNGADHVNLWMGPANPMDNAKIAACMARAVPDIAVDVTINPSAKLAVDTTPMYTSNNNCTLKLYPNGQPVGTPTVTPATVATPTPKTVPTPTPTTIPSATATEPVTTPTPTTSTNTNSAYVKSGDGSQQSVTTTVTFYGFNDNSGATEAQHGSADIAYPKSDGYPTLHNEAHEGSGTYTDPVTFAAPNKDLNSSFPIGSVIYVPLVKKYFIMEDECGDDDPQGCQNGANHADLYMGPSQAVDGTKLDNCEGNATPNGPVQVTINPSSTLDVDTTTMYTSSDQCTIKLYN